MTRVKINATTCPHCNQTLDPALVRSMAASLNGATTSKAKSEAAKANGKKGGRPAKDGRRI